jgi:hypothetical protein
MTFRRAEYPLSGDGSKTGVEQKTRMEAAAKKKLRRTNGRTSELMEDGLDKPVLQDETVYPDDEVIFSHLGKTGSLWTSFFENLDSGHPDFSREWRYYRDGKSWLMKVQAKKKTVSASYPRILQDHLLFHRRAEAAVRKPHPGELKEQFEGCGTIRYAAHRDVQNKGHQYAKALSKSSDQVKASADQWKYWMEIYEHI